MTTTARQTRYDTERVRVICPTCQQPRHVCRRHANAIRSGTETGICSRCRYPATATAPVRVTESMKNYWRDRYTQDEIADLAAGIDTLLNDFSKYARGRRHPGARQEIK